MSNLLRRFLMSGKVSLPDSLDPNDYCTITAVTDNTTVYFTPAVISNIKYSFDLQTWDDFERVTVVLNAGDLIYVKNDLYKTHLGKFSINGLINLSGNCNSLIYGGKAKYFNSVPSDIFHSLFASQGVVNISNGFLPATSVGSSSYREMFSECKDLVSMPDLPAVLLDQYSYYKMFCGCSKLYGIHTFKTPNIKYYTYYSTFKDTKVKFDTTSLDFTSKKVASEGGFIGMFMGVEISKDDLLNYIKHNNNGKPYLPLLDIPKYAYYEMFADSYLEEAPDLPATTLSEYCYARMFYNCKTLKKSSTISATEIPSFACNCMYSNSSIEEIPPIEFDNVSSHGCFSMYAKCESLNKIEKLHINKINYYGCAYMFTDCSALNSIKNSSLRGYSEHSCSGMFSNCTNIVDVSNIYLQDISTHSYSAMFKGCTNLVIPCNLEHLTKIDGTSYTGTFQQMFEGCTSLVEAPKLPTTTGYGIFHQMFKDCTSLKEVPALPKGTIRDRAFYEMFKGCTSITKVPKLPSRILSAYAYSGMFEGCTSITEVPDILPAETLYAYCYKGMFKDCINIETAPVLPATNLVDSCYVSMFEGCNNLKYIKALFTTTPSEEYTKNWVSNVSAQGTFVKSTAASWDITGNNGIPEGWSIEYADA